MRSLNFSHPRQSVLLRPLLRGRISLPSCGLHLLRHCVVGLHIAKVRPLSFQALAHLDHLDSGEGCTTPQLKWSLFFDNTPWQFLKYNFGI